MTELDVLEYLGYCLGAWSMGYLLGFKILCIRKFTEQI